MYDDGMFGALTDAVETLEIPLHRDALVEVHQLCDRLAAKACVAAAAYDAADGPAADGCVSLAQWLRHYGGRSRRDAAREAATARRLRQLPVVSDRWLDGTLSSGQVAAIVANVSDRTVESFAAQEAALVPRLAALSAADTATVMRQWAACAEALLPDEEPAEPARSLHLSPTLGGRGELSGSFDAEATAILDTALRQATRPDVEGEAPRVPSERRADALVDVCRFFLDHQQTKPGGRHRPHVSVVIDLDDWEHGRPGATADGIPLDGSVISRLACDGALHRMLTARGAILDYGTATRAVPAPLYNALVLRDGHCRIGGCDRPPHRCEAHHVQWVEHGGPTSLDNLVLVCSRHHHLIHQHRWEVKLLPDGTVDVTLPDGCHLTSRPPPRRMVPFTPG
jgi:hypothetical protein